MAAKLKCNHCGKMLKEEGDEMKLAEGEYRVYENLWNGHYKKGRFRLILCLKCHKIIKELLIL